MNQKNFLLALRIAAITCLLGVLSDRSDAGQAFAIPHEEMVKSAHLIAVVEVEKVESIAVGRSRIHVAQAVVLETLKGGSQGETIAIVSSSIPRSSAVWRPIEKGKYLAYLKAEMGHFRFGYVWAFRKISDKKMVPWLEYKRNPGAAPAIKTYDVKIEDAMKQVAKLVGNTDPALLKRLEDAAKESTERAGTSGDADR